MDLIENAFNSVRRENFVPHSLRNQSHVDAPLPIGFGQTISQPSTVKHMLKWLDARPNQKILDIGFGSGWTSALLSKIIEPNGKVFAVERIPELVKIGRENCENIGIKNVIFFQAKKEYGLPDNSPYDRILVSASSNTFPKEILKQLKSDGKLIIPVKNDILEITKKTDDNYSTITHPGFIFVPLIKN